MRAERKQDIEGIFVKLRSDGEYEETSDETDAYNCIAWALHDTQQWWWYTPHYGCYWPPGVPRDNRLETVVKIFEIHGYTKCSTDLPETGYEKVAIYEHRDFGVQHAARQLQDGGWTSKLGEWEDIKHRTPQSILCDDYGEVVQIMKRRRKEWDI